MVTNEDMRNAFSARFNTLLDENGILPKGKGRQKELADMFKVTDKGARKWIEGESIPNITKLIEIVEKFKTSGATIEWLLTGNPEFAPYSQRVGLADVDEIKENPAVYMLPSKITELKTLLRIGVSDDTLTQDYIPQLLKLMEQLTKTLMILTAKVEEKKLDGRDG